VQYANNYPYLYGIIFAMTRNVANVDVDHRPRTNGSSNYTFRALLSLWCNGFINYSVTPLRLSMYLGFGITCVGFIVALALVIQRLTGPTHSIGWTSLIVTIIFFSGVQLMSVGVIGEYIGRLYLSSSKLPRVIVRETINIEGQDKGTEPR
jgi:undecaprenyl-phosphate 4-deoxy-4-formamido-L-arabinose transferase